MDDAAAITNERTPAELLAPLFEGDVLGIIGALFNVQGNLPKLRKRGKGEKKWMDKNNKWQSFTYNYIKSEDLFPAALALCHEHRILVFQAPYSCLADGNFYVMTFFKHVDTGGSVRFAYPVCSLRDKKGQQDMAAANTPAKRHALTQALMIVAEDDKDAQDSKATIGEPEPEPEAKKPYKTVAKAESKGETAELTAAQKKADTELGTKLWKRALSNKVTLQDILADLEEAKGIKTASTKDNVVKALTIRELSFKADTMAQIVDARKRLSEIPEKLRTSQTDGVRADKILNGFIDESERTLPGVAP